MDSGESIKETEFLVTNENLERNITESGTVDNESEDVSDTKPLLSALPSVQGVNTKQSSISSSSPSGKNKDLKLNIPSALPHTQLVLPILKKQQSALSTNSAIGPLKMAVFVKRDKRLGECRYILELEKGRSTTAGEIKEVMLDLLAIPKTCGHLFALWLISPHLELQLKYQHTPFYLRKQWCDFLLKFSDCPPDELSLDEPVVVFQRNSFITVEEERNYSISNVLKQLFEEASHNILKARYLVSVAEAEKLGGILLRCYEGEFNADIHKAGYFKKRLNDFLPYYTLGSNKISQYIYSSGAEQRLLQHYEEISSTCKDKDACYHVFLDICRNLSFYGSAFFRGYCFLEGAEYKIWKNEMQPITIGLNRYGLTLLDPGVDEMLCHLSYSEFSWDYKKCENTSDNSSCEEDELLDCFIIEYDENAETRQIQIVSKQACMIDAMVQSCVNFLDDVPPSPSPDSKDRKKLTSISYKASDLTSADVVVA